MFSLFHIYVDCCHFYLFLQNGKHFFFKCIVQVNSYKIYVLLTGSSIFVTFTSLITPACECLYVKSMKCILTCKLYFMFFYIIVLHCHLFFFFIFTFIYLSVFCLFVCFTCFLYFWFVKKCFCGVTTCIMKG